MDSQPIIRSATHADLDTLVDTLSDSFSNDPILNWVIPQASLYPDFFRMIIRDVYLPHGISHLEEQGRGAALWLPPGREFAMPTRFGLLSLFVRLIMRQGLKPLRRVRQQADTFDQYHPTEPHYYLQFIGARLRNQGQGVGSALLKHGIRVCDEQSMPAYLESSNVLNVPLYQRYGFEVTNEVTLPDGGPTAWFMWKRRADARTNASSACRHSTSASGPSISTRS